MVMPPISMRPGVSSVSLAASSVFECTTHAEICLAHGIHCGGKGYMLPIFGNQLLWRYFSVLGPITQMGKNGSLALAGAALGMFNLIFEIRNDPCNFITAAQCWYIFDLQPTQQSVCWCSYQVTLQAQLWTHCPPRLTEGASTLRSKT